MGLAADSTERAPLLNTARPYRQVLVVATLCAIYVGLSSSLINFNKFMMQKEYFPYSVGLTFLHMCGSTLFSVVLVAIFGTSWYPSLPDCKAMGGSLVGRLAPLAACFAFSIAMSNQAYVYCSVPFLQMCKELNIVMVYLAGVLLATDRFDLQQATILLIITAGCCTSIHGEMKFSTLGFACQISGQVAEVFKVLLQQKIMQGCKIDPLTMVLLMSPLCLVALACGLPFVYDSAMLTAAVTHWPLLLLSACNAFALNLAVAAVIKHASALSFVLAGVVKDVAIVLVAALAFHATVTPTQYAGFTVAVTGIAVHSLVRMTPDVAKEQGVLAVIRSAFSPPKKLEGTP